MLHSVTVLVAFALTTFLALGPAVAIELEQFTGAAHAYPAILDLYGKRLADGEFTQQIQNDLLRVRITYDLINGGRIEEKAAFKQRPEFIQKEWSWRDCKAESLLREYTIDFDAGKATVRKREADGMKDWSEQVELEQGRTFAGFGFVLALQNLRDRLVKNEIIELRAVGFTPKPRVVTVKVSYHGLDRVRMSGRDLRGEHFVIQPEIPAVAKLFVKISETHVWLTPPPSGFLRSEGPMVEPSDSLVRVDLASGGESGPAKAVGKESGDQR